jgi:hypothetical protein
LHRAANVAKLKTYGAPKTLALRAVCGMNNDEYTAQQISDGLTFVRRIDNGAGYADAKAKVDSADSTKPAEVLIKSAINAVPHVANPTCKAVYNAEEKRFDYTFDHFLPATTTVCGQDGVQAFFNVTKSATFGNTVQYLYNPNQGTNQYSSDLVTATFPQGFQVILAGTGTTGTTQSTPQSNQAGGAGGGTSVADPVATAVQKIEAGGDFNLRFSLPVLSTPPGDTVWLTYFQPSLGFNLASTTGSVNKSTGAQTGISSTSQYLVYVPLESYFETSSIAGTASNGWTSATLYADVRFGGEIVSHDFQRMLGVPNRAFVLGQASAGINFASSFRVGMQYFWGPSQVYTLTNSSGQTGTVNTSIKGFHVVLTFSPQKKAGS